MPMRKLLFHFNSINAICLYCEKNFPVCEIFAQDGNWGCAN